MLCLACAWLWWPGPKLASAHVAPAVKENNRYLKLTLFGDHARLAVVLYFGEIPGQKARQEMDRDHDGTISDAEADSFARLWAERVKDGTKVTVDGASVPLDWDSIDVGMPNRAAIDGAFSIDLVTALCVDRKEASTPHRLEIRESFELPEPGETEIIPEESPGIEITKLELAGESSPTLQWNGAGGPLRAGLLLEWTGPNEPSSVCAAKRRAMSKSTDRGAIRKLLPMILGAFAALIAIGVVLIRRRRGK